MQMMLALAPLSPFSVQLDVSNSSLCGQCSRERLVPSALSKPGGVEAAVLWDSEGGEGMSSRMEGRSSPLASRWEALPGLLKPSPVKPCSETAFCRRGACPTPKMGRRCGNCCCCCCCSPWCGVLQRMVGEDPAVAAGDQEELSDMEPESCPELGAGCRAAWGVRPGVAARESGVDDR